MKRLAKQPFILDSPEAKGILDTIKANEGISQSELSRLLNKPLHWTQYRLLILSSVGKVRLDRGPGYNKVFFMEAEA